MALYGEHGEIGVVLEEEPLPARVSDALAEADGRPLLVQRLQVALRGRVGRRRASGDWREGW